MHLLRKAIRSYKKRHRNEPKIELEIHFKKWKDIIVSLKNKEKEESKNEDNKIEDIKKNLEIDYKKDEEKERNDDNINEDEKNVMIDSNKDQVEEIKQLSHSKKNVNKEEEKEDSKGEDNADKEKGEEKVEENEEKGEEKEIEVKTEEKKEKENVEEKAEDKEKEKEEEKEEEEEGDEENEEKKKTEINIDNNETKKGEENQELSDDKKESIGSENDKILSSIDDIIKLNSKIQNKAYDVIKRTDKKIYDKIDPEKFIKILESNNKRILSYKLFCLYANYNESTSFCTKNIFPKKFYFDYWYKNSNNK